MKVIIFLLLFFANANATDYIVKIVSNQNNIKCFVKNETNNTIKYKGFQFPMVSSSIPISSSILWSWDPSSFFDFRIMPNSHTVIAYDFSMTNTLTINPNEEKLIIEGIITPNSVYSYSPINKYLFILRNDSTIDVSKYTSFIIDNLTETRNNTELISEFSISQNYPNPFNPITEIKIFSPDRHFVNIKIYDIQGKEIMTIFNNLVNYGITKVLIDMSSYPSGVYFYSSTINNKKITKTLMLLK